MTTTDLTRWEPADDKPLLLLVDEAHPWPTTGNGKSRETLTRQMLAAVTAEMARRQAEQRAEIGRKVDTAGALTVLTAAITGVAFTALNSPELVGYPIGATLAAIAISAPTLYRRPKAAR